VGKILFTDTCLANGTGFRLKSDFGINAIAWNFGDIGSGSTNISAEVNPKHVFSKAGKYLISATVNATCGLFLTTDSVTIINCPPPCAATLSFKDSCIENGTVFSINSFYTILSASWNFGDSLSGSISNNSDLVAPLHEFSKAGNYNILAQIELTCGTKQAAKPISIVNCTCKAFVPNLLIADGNGVNDIFEISNLCATKSFRLKIYNRWGKEVFASENPNEKWDSNTVGSGTYFYALDLLYESAPPESLKGWVNVMK
jgi:gliding motility-associated-like protein